MPSDPFRLQVVDRIVDVLQSIQEGENYFFSPRQVTKGFIAEPSAYPVYMVTSESGGDIAMHSDAQFAETFYVAIRGIVQDAGDVVTPLERAIRDVRKAVEADFQPGGTLITLATEVVFDTPPEIDYGFEGTGFWDISYRESESALTASSERYDGKMALVFEGHVINKRFCDG